METSRQPGHKNRLAEIDEELVSRIRSEIIEAVDPEMIVLIGSAARGQAGVESDLDVVVVTHLDEGESPWEKASEIHGVFRGWRVPLDIIVVTPEEYERGRRLPGHVARTANREGRTLYDRAG